MNKTRKGYLVLAILILVLGLVANIFPRDVLGGIVSGRTGGLFGFDSKMGIPFVWKETADHVLVRDSAGDRFQRFDAVALAADVLIPLALVAGLGLFARRRAYPQQVG
jgi:hypothetical protein